MQLPNIDPEDPEHVASLLALLTRQGRGGEAARDEIRRSVQTLAADALASRHLIDSDALATVRAMVADIDQKIERQLGEILRHPDLVRLEASWRGLWFLCSNPDLNDQVSIRVMNLRKPELRRHGGPLRRLLEDGGGAHDGATFGAVLVDFEFDIEEDQEVLSNLAQIGAAAHAPFVCATSPASLGLASFDDLQRPENLALTPRADAAWTWLRANPAARFIALALPRVLMRRPYLIAAAEGAFEFRQDRADAQNRIWANAVWAVGDLMLRSFVEHAWFAAIGDPGLAANATGFASYPAVDDDGEPITIGPVETAVSVQRERELAALGFLPILRAAASTDVVIDWPRTVFREATVDRTGSRVRRQTFASDLRAMLCVGRIAAYVKHLWRAMPLKVASEGTTVEALSLTESLELRINRWLSSYVAPDDGPADAERPFRQARFLLSGDAHPDDGRDARIEVWPQYQFTDAGPIVLDLQLGPPRPRPLLASMRDQPPVVGSAPREGSVAPMRLVRVAASRQGPAALARVAPVLRSAGHAASRLLCGPITVSGTIDAARPIEELVDFVVSDSASLEIDLGAFLTGVPFDADRLGFLALYPSGVIRGISAQIVGADGRHRLLLHEPLALLDPDLYLPPGMSSAIHCDLDLFILEAVGHDA